MSEALLKPRLGIFYGPMMGGKSFELVRHMHRLRPRFKGRTVLVVKRNTLHLSDSPCVLSRSGASITEKDVDAVMEIDELIEVTRHYFTPETEPSLFAIDEAHFMNGLFEVVRHLLFCGHTVLVAGLDLNWKGRAFSKDGMLSLLELAPEINVHCPAVCSVCTSQEGVFTGKYEGESDAEVEVGATQFAPLCRPCWLHRKKHGFKFE